MNYEGKKILTEHATMKQNNKQCVCYNTKFIYYNLKINIFWGVKCVFYF